MGVQVWTTIGVTLVEIPAAPPACTLNSTVTRFPSDGLKTALRSQVQQVVPLIKIQSLETGYPAIYLTDRRCTVGGQLYQARLIDFDGISQGMGNESFDADTGKDSAREIREYFAPDFSNWKDELPISRRSSV